MKGPSFEKGYKMYLLHKNIIIKRPNDKLDFKKFKPFIIIRKILENNYKLSLSKTIQIHLIFHISLLEPTLKSAKTQERRIEIAFYQVYEVEAIIDERQQKRIK